MKVFLSWSGSTSRAVAEALAEWLPKVIQGIDPFVSAKDIDKGSNWTVELASELEDAEFGIVCLAPDNLLSPWLNYETGAITKSVNSRVCPVLFAVQKEDILPPMSQLQLTSLDQEDVALLMKSMNKTAGEPIGAAALQEAVVVWWPMLEAKLSVISTPKSVEQSATAPEPAKPQVDAGEMIEEVLHRVRSLDDRIRSIEARDRRMGIGRTRVNANLSAELLTVAVAAGFPSSKVQEGPSSIDLYLDVDLPDILPSEFYGVAWRMAQTVGKRVRVVAPNRTATFEKDGMTDESPF